MLGAVLILVLGVLVPGVVPRVVAFWGAAVTRSLLSLVSLGSCRRLRGLLLPRPLGRLRPGVLSAFRGEGLCGGFKDILLTVREQQVITVRFIQKRGRAGSRNGV